MRQQATSNQVNEQVFDEDHRDLETWEAITEEYNHRNPGHKLSTMAVRSIHRRALKKLRAQLADLAELVQ